MPSDPVPSSSRQGTSRWRIRLAAAVLFGVCLAAGAVLGRTTRTGTAELVAPEPSGPLSAVVTPSPVPEVGSDGAAAEPVGEPVPQLTPLVGTATAPLPAAATMALAAEDLAPLDRPDFGVPLDGAGDQAGPDTGGGADPGAPAGGGDLALTLDGVPVVGPGATTIRAEVAVFVDPCTVDPDGCPQGIVARIGADRPPALGRLSFALQTATDGTRGECERRYGASPSRDLYLTVLANRPLQGRLQGTFLQGRGERVDLDVQLSDVAVQRWARDWPLGLDERVSHCVRIPQEVWERNLGAHSDQQFCFIICDAWLDGRLRLTGVLADSDGTRAEVDTTLGIPAGRDRDTEFSRRAALAEITPLTATMLRVRTTGVISAAALFPYDTDCSVYDPVANTPAPVSTQLGRTQISFSPYGATTILRLPDDLPGVALYRLCVFVHAGGADRLRDVDIIRVEEHVVSPPAAARYEVRVFPRRGRDLQEAAVDIRLERGDDDSNPLARAGLLTDRCALRRGQWVGRLRPEGDPNLLCTVSSRSVFPDGAAEGIVHVHVSYGGGAAQTQAIRLRAGGCVATAASCAETDEPLHFPEVMVLVSRRRAPAELPDGVLTTLADRWQIDHTGPVVVRSSDGVGTASADPVPAMATRPVVTATEMSRRFDLDRPVEFVEGRAVPVDAEVDPSCTRPVTVDPTPTPAVDRLPLRARELCPGTSYGMTVTVRTPASGRTTTYSSLLSELGTAVPVPTLGFRTAPGPVRAVETQVEVLSLPEGTPAQGVVPRATVLWGDVAALDASNPVGPDGQGRPGERCRPLRGLVAAAQRDLPLTGANRLRARVELLPLGDGCAARATSRRITVDLDQVVPRWDGVSPVVAEIRRPDGLALRVAIRPLR